MLDRLEVAASVSHRVFLRLETGGESLLEFGHLRGGGPGGHLRLLSRLLTCLLRLVLRARAVTDGAHARADRRALARIARDGPDHRATRCPTQRPLHGGTRRGLPCLLLLLCGLLLQFGGLVGNVERIAARFLHSPGVAVILV